VNLRKQAFAKNAAKVRCGAQPGHSDFSLRAHATEEMLHALEIWRCDAAMEPAIVAARSEARTVNLQGADFAALQPSKSNVWF